MGKFDGYLICSDFDGTIFIKKQISRENLDAIEYFQSQGGRFTFSSGRTYEMFTREPANQIKPNAPIISLGGSVIISPDGKEIYHKGGITKDEAREIFALYDSGVDLKSVDINEIIAAANYRFDENDTPEAREKFLDSLESPYTKMLTRMHEATSDETYEEVRRRLAGKFNVTRSWRIGIEINAINDSKGRAALFLKEMFGCHTLVCVGDYDNDIDMIKAADIGYAVAGATDTLKAAADRVTVTAEEHAIAAIIAELEAEMK